MSHRNITFAGISGNEFSSGYVPNRTNSFQSSKSSSWNRSMDMGYDWSYEFDTGHVFLTKKFMVTVPRIFSDPCAICWEDFEKNQSASMIQCAHVFHTHCLEDWFVKSKTCPTCRYECNHSFVEDGLSKKGKLILKIQIPPIPQRKQPRVGIVDGFKPFASEFVEYIPEKSLEEHMMYDPKRKSSSGVKGKLTRADKMERRHQRHR